MRDYPILHLDTNEHPILHLDTNEHPILHLDTNVNEHERLSNITVRHK